VWERQRGETKVRKEQPGDDNDDEDVERSYFLEKREREREKIVRIWVFLERTKFNECDAN